MATFVIRNKDNDIKVIKKNVKIEVYSRTNVISVKSSGRRGPPGSPGLGIPSGGEIGQIVVKEGSADYEIGWQDPATTFGDKNYEQSFTPSSFITVNHNLNKFPSIMIKDSAGDEVEGTVNHLNKNTLTVMFSSAFGGTISCN